MIMRGLISGLIRRVSAEHQLRNTTSGLRKFIDSANILTAAWAAGHEPSKGQVAYFNKRKGLFCKDTLGGIGIDQLRRVLISHWPIQTMRSSSPASAPRHEANG